MPELESSGPKQFEIESMQLEEEGRELAQDLQAKLNERAEELGVDLRFNISPPEMPEGLTERHLEIFKQCFDGSLEAMVLPKPAELDNFSNQYAEVMYPPEDEVRQKRDAEERNGLVAFATPFVFYEPVELDSDKGTWGEMLLRSMKEELGSLQQTHSGLILVETTSKEENRSNSDPLFSIFQEVFGDSAGRFARSYDELVSKFLPKIKEKIKEKLREEKLTIPDFEVTAIPASIANLSMTFYHPENSTHGTDEWTSTLLVDRENRYKDLDFRLLVGDPKEGGASYVCDDPSYVQQGSVRFSILFKK